MYKIILKITLIISLLINSAGQGYALRPMAVVVSKDTRGLESVSSVTENAKSSSAGTGNYEKIKEMLSKVRYKDAVIDSEDLGLDLPLYVLTLNIYCNKACTFCFAHLLPLPEDGSRDPEAIISDEDFDSFLDILELGGKKRKVLLITGDGEPFLEFEKILHLIKHAPVRELSIKTNGFWAADEKTTEDYLEKLAKVADENPDLQFLVILLSGDENHNNIKETVQLADSFLKLRCERSTKDVEDKLLLHISCMGSVGFKRYWDDLRTLLREKKMDFMLESRGAKPNLRYFVTIRKLTDSNLTGIKTLKKDQPIYGILPHKGDRNVIYWMANFPSSEGRAHHLWDTIRKAWIDLYDLMQVIMNLRKKVVPIYLKPFIGRLKKLPPILYVSTAVRDPYVPLKDYQPTGIHEGNLFYRYNGSMTLNCSENELLAFGEFLTSNQEMVKNANNNPFLRAIAEGRIKEILEFVSKKRPQLTEKIPFGTDDIGVMDWLLDQDEDLAMGILKFILHEDYQDRRLTEESAAALGLKSSSSGDEIDSLSDRVKTIEDNLPEVIKRAEAYILMTYDMYDFIENYRYLLSLVEPYSQEIIDIEIKLLDVEYETLADEDLYEKPDDIASNVPKEEMVDIQDAEPSSEQTKIEALKIRLNKLEHFFEPLRQPLARFKGSQKRHEEIKKTNRTLREKEKQRLIEKGVLPQDAIEALKDRYIYNYLQSHLEEYKRYITTIPDDDTYSQFKQRCEEVIENIAAEIQALEFQVAVSFDIEDAYRMVQESIEGILMSASEKLNAEYFSIELRSALENMDEQLPAASPASIGSLEKAIDRQA